MKTMTIECPDQLHEQLQTLVAAGWVKDANQAAVEALRRFLESHRPELMEEQLRKDVEWGLHGAA
jgi:Arc/MetJ-type ribon-helix-helix transcriptional regulator